MPIFYINTHIWNGFCKSLEVGHNVPEYLDHLCMRSLLTFCLASFAATSVNIVHANAQTYSTDCGINSIQLSERTESPLLQGLSTPLNNIIRGGQFANIEEMPGLVHLRFYSEIDILDGRVQRAVSGTCGGTRISEDLIVTAAHCASPGTIAVEVNYGKNSLVDPGRGRAFVENVRCHAGYSANGLHNDIAVIDISSSNLDDLKDNVSIAPFGDTNQILNVSRQNGDPFGNNVTFTVAGWGTTRPYSEMGNTPNNDPTKFLLKKGTVGLIWKGPEKILTEPAGSPPSSICSGDSGGPLYWSDASGQKHIIGLVSSQLVPSGEEQCSRANKAIFQNYASFVPWINTIQETVENNTSATINFTTGPVQENLSNEDREDLDIFQAAREDAIRATAKYLRHEDGFARFKASTFRESGPYGKWIVNGDTPISSEVELEEFYYRRMVGQARLDNDYQLIIDAVRGIEVRLPDIEMTYCISRSFDTLHYRRYDEVVETMRLATAEWERYANIKFVHDSTQDSNCTPENNRVIFDVRPVNVSGRYLARAFFPKDEDRRFRNILIDHTAFYLGDGTTGMSLEGVMRHEIGHVLGARHEHIRPESGACFFTEDQNYSVRTAYDRNSVMHYPQCNGNPDSLFQLTEKDKSGIACVYPQEGFAHDNSACYSE